MIAGQSRREFTKLALSALPGAALFSAGQRLFAADAKRPNSRFNGVQLGINAPYSFGGRTMSGEETLERCVELGLSAVELRTQPVELFLGVPLELLARKPRESKQARAERAEKLRAWRKTAPLDRAKKFREKWESAGVFIEIVKVDGMFGMTDEELDYKFALAKALGGRAISTEISHDEKDLKRVGAFADKHEFMVGYHGHASTRPEHWEHAFELAKFNGANVDLGHFVAGNNASPVPFLKKHHSRVTHVHLKDREFNNGPNAPFGEGDTPLAEVLRLIRDNKWNIQATIEFEYKVPKDSTRMAEIARAIRFCRDALA